MSALLLAQTLATIVLPAAPVPVLPDHGYELPAAPPRVPPVQRSRDEALPQLDPARFPVGFVPPSKSWGEKGGPVLEVAALGAGRKGTPRVVHMSLGWDF